MKEKVKARVAELKALAIQLYPQIAKRHQFKSMKVEVVAEIKGARGLCWQASNYIQICMKSLQEDEEYMLREVVGHEVVHIIAPLLYGQKGWGHTPSWKKVMAEMGLEPVK